MQWFPETSANRLRKQREASKAQYKPGKRRLRLNYGIDNSQHQQNEQCDPAREADASDPEQTTQLPEQ
ncbi:MAG: hypothetical protein ACK5YO_15800 [Planctomyces sp.]